MSEDVQNQEVPATGQSDTAETQAPAGPDLNITDLSALRNIVEIASQRGAFKAAELEVVGKTYNKLSAFLEAVSKKEQ
jgi:hypothetical protein